MKAITRLIFWMMLASLLLFIPNALAWDELITSVEIKDPSSQLQSRAVPTLIGFLKSDENVYVDQEYTYKIKRLNEAVAKIEIIVALRDNSYSDGNKLGDVYYHPDFLTELDENNCWTFSYTYRLLNERYTIIAYPYDANGEPFLTDDGVTKEQVNISRTVTRNPDSDPNQPTRIQEEIENAFDEIEIGDDYQTALAIHNWINNNCTYDEGKHYYSAEELLMNNRGVCNSYARCFVLLMERAGKNAKRVMGKGLPPGALQWQKHAWNIAEIDGSWYQFDLTWDDGNTRFEYFAITDKLMGVNHIQNNIANYSGSIPCNSLESNYYVKEEKWRNYSDSILPVLQDAIDNGFAEFSVNMPTTYQTTAHIHVLIRDVLAYVIPAYSWKHTLSGTSVANNVHIVYDESSYQFTGTYTRENEMTLPSGVTAIEEEAFAGVTAARYLTVPESCTAIGTRAFAESGFWCVYLPAGLTDIAADAFENAPYLRVLAPSGSAAAAKLRTLNVHMATY